MTEVQRKLALQYNELDHVTNRIRRLVDELGELEADALAWRAMQKWDIPEVAGRDQSRERRAVSDRGASGAGRGRRRQMKTCPRCQRAPVLPGRVSSLPQVRLRGLLGPHAAGLSVSKEGR